MKACDVCGNLYAEPIEVIHRGVRYTFDSLECAIQRIAPTCEHCGCRVIGHGVESAGVVFCCAHCARQSGVEAVVDHA